MGWLTTLIRGPAQPTTQLATRPAPTNVPSRSNSNVPARKAGKATAYTAQGIQPPVVDFETGSALEQQVRELVPELTSPAVRRQTFGQMMNDASVDVSVRSIKTPVIGADFFMEPYSDNPNDVLINQFIWDNLAGGMAAPFINSIEDIVSFFENGKTILEKVYEMRSWNPGSSGANSKNYTMLKKLGLRPESSIKDILYDDNGGPLTILHGAVRADKKVEDVEIPISKALIFTFNRKGGRVDGKSILRTAYPHWFYKTHLYKIDAIQKERHSIGVPRGKLLPGWNEKDVAIMRTLLRNLRTNEESFILQTPKVEIDFAKVEGQLVDVMASADHHNFMIMMNVMAQFLVNTQGGSGGRAASATQVDIFLKALKYIANYICDVFNMYLIPELVVWNFPTTNFPKLKVKNLGETKDLQMLASAFANLMAQGGITSDLDTENYFRKVFDIPLKQPNAEPTVVDSATTSKDQKGDVKPGADKSGNIGKSPSSPN